MGRYTVHQRFLLLTLLPAIAIAALLGCYLLYTRIADLHDFINERGDATTMQLAAATRHALERNTTSIEREFVTVTLEERGVRSVTLYNRDRVPVAHAGPLMRPAKNVSERFAHQLVALTTRDGLRFVRPVYTTTLTEQLSNGDNVRPRRIVGWVEVEYSTAPFLVKAYRTALTGVLLMFAVLGATALLSLQLGRRVDATLLRIRNTVNHLGKGDLHARVRTDDTSDLGLLADEINRMAAAAEESQAEMQRQMEQTTRDLRQTLETIEVQNIELDIARREAVEASRIKSEFLANTSHEIRTPLNGIIGFTNLLLNTAIDGRQRDYLVTIKQSSENLLAIINDILDFSKIEAGKLLLDHVPLELRPMLDDTLAALAPSADEKGLELTLLIYPDVPARIVGDPLRIRQIVTNLASNAIKFTDQGSIIVRVRRESPDEGEKVVLVFSVTDTGIGLSAEQQRNVFEAFRQGNSPVSRPVGGTGLGLVISRRLVEQMGGEMGLQSEAGKGATFWFSLKMNAAPGPSAPPPSALAGKRIAVVEASGASQLALRYLLEQWGCKVDAYDSIERLLLAADIDNPPDVVVAMLHRDEPADATARRIRTQLCAPLVLLTPGGTQPVDQPEPGTVVLTRPVIAARLQPALTTLLGGDATPTVAGAVLPENARRQEPVRILAVDDNAANLKLLCIILAELGAEPVSATDGEQAVALCERQSFDAILMDIRMPGIDGIEATRRIRTGHNGNRNTPIIALTAHALAEEKRALLAAGMNEYVVKPIDRSALVLTLQRWCPQMRPPADIPLAPPGINDARQEPSPRAVDLEASLERANRNPQLATEMLASLLSRLDRDYQGITDAWRDGDIEALTDAVHRLHGAACYTGVPRLGQLLRRLEAAAKRGHDEEVEALMEPLGDAVTELLQWAREHDVATLFDPS